MGFNSGFKGLTSAPDGNRVVSSTPRPLHLRGNSRNSHRTEGSGPSAGLQAFQNRNISCVCKESKNSPTGQPAAYLLYQLSYFAIRAGMQSGQEKKIHICRKCSSEQPKSIPLLGAVSVRGQDVTNLTNTLERW